MLDGVVLKQSSVLLPDGLDLVLLEDKVAVDQICEHFFALLGQIEQE